MANVPSHSTLGAMTTESLGNGSAQLLAFSVSVTGLSALRVLTN